MEVYMKLAMSQIVLGTLVAVSALLDTIYGLPSLLRVFENTTVSVFWDAEVGTRRLIFVAVFFILGLRALGLGIAQLLKTREKNPKEFPLSG